MKKVDIEKKILLSKLIPEDLLRFGLIPEFIGRFPVLATLEQLDEAGIDRYSNEAEKCYCEAISKNA